MVNREEHYLVDPVLDDSITVLIRQGKHEDAWGLTLELEDIFRLYYQIQIRLDQSRFLELEKLLQEGLDLAHNHPDPKIKNIWYKLKLYQIVVLLFIDSRRGIDNYNKIQDILQQDDEFTLGMNNLISGLIYNDPKYYQASIDHLIASEELPMLSVSYAMLMHFLGGRKSIELIDEVIGIFQQFGHKNFVNSLSCVKGSLYQALGDYKSARLLNTIAFEECTKTNWLYGVANASLCLGNIAIEEGNISEAIQRLEQSSEIFYQHLGYNLGAPILIEAYRYAGLYNKGLEVALYTLDRMIFSPALYERFFVEITLLVLDMNNIKLAKELYERFKSLVGTIQDSTIENSLKLCEALILKQSRSLSTSYKSQSILRGLLQSTTTTCYIRIETIKHLCELLLVEYEIYEQKEILDEIQEYINNLSTIAQEQNQIRLNFEARIITSKLELLNNDFSKARQILADLLEYAGHNNFLAYERVVNREIAVLDENYQKWLNLVEGNSSMRELIEKTKIKNYMTNAIKQMGNL